MTLNSVYELILRPFIKDNLGIKSMKQINHYTLTNLSLITSAIISWKHGKHMFGLLFKSNKHSMPIVLWRPRWLTCTWRHIKVTEILAM